MAGSSVWLIKDNLRNVTIALGLPYFNPKKAMYFEKPKV